MRAAAAAIVFILGAAVILVFANSLNSWVLGGLIGGLAALLISIPISVMLFTVLSRHHDLKLQTLHQELGEMGYVNLDENGYEEVYEADAYVLSDEEYYNQTVNRRMADVRALPAAGQSYASAHREINERVGRSTQSSRRPSQALPQGRGQGTPTRDLSSERRQVRRSMHEVNAMRSRFQTAALQAARREAQQLDDVDVIPTHTQAPNKSVSQGRTSQSLGGQSGSSRQADNNKPLIKTVPNVLLMLLQVSRTVRDDLHLQGSYPRLIGHYRQILFIWMNFNQINFATVLPIRKQTIFVFTLKPVRWYAIRSWGSHNGILI